MSNKTFMYTVLPRSNLTHAVRSRLVRFAAAVRAVRGYGSCGSRLRFVRFAVTRVKTHNLFRVDKNSLEQCCAAHIVQCCQQYCSALLHLIAG